MITVKLTGTESLITRLKKVPPSVFAALVAKTWALAINLQGYIRSNKLSGQVLNVISGDLRRSINIDVIEEGQKVIGKVFSSGDVKYAGIHEYGGTTRPHMIYPRKAEVLAFMGKSGDMVFAKSVSHPGSVMPERSFMRSSLAENAVAISEAYKLTVLEAAKAGVE